MTPYPSARTIKRLEREYWDTRAAQEHTPQTQLAWFETAAQMDDEWGLVGYLRRLRTLPRGTRVLEVGAGVGSQAVGLAFACGHYALVTDLSHAAMRAGREALGSASTSVAFCVADGECLPVRTGCFDVVLGHATLHHFPNPGMAFGEMARCLRGGGLLVIGHEPNATVFGPIRWLADQMQITERYTKRFVPDRYSVADDVAAGFRASELLSLGASCRLELVSLEPVWLLTAWAFHLPILAGLFLRKQPRVPRSVRRACLDVDRVLFHLLPSLRNLALFWSFTARKNAGGNDMACRCVTGEVASSADTPPH